MNVRQPFYTPTKWSKQLNQKPKAVRIIKKQFNQLNKILLRFSEKQYVEFMNQLIELV